MFNGSHGFFRMPFHRRQRCRLWVSSPFNPAGGHQKCWKRDFKWMDLPKKKWNRCRKIIGFWWFVPHSYGIMFGRSWCHGFLMGFFRFFTMLSTCVNHPRKSTGTAPIRKNRAFSTTRPRVNSATSRTSEDSFRTAMDGGAIQRPISRYTLWLCQNSYWKWPYIVDFPIKNGDFP